MKKMKQVTKAEFMWAADTEPSLAGTSVWRNKKQAQEWQDYPLKPVWLVDATSESYDRMVEQMAHADVVRGGQSDDQYDLYMDLTRPRMRRLLRAIGIIKPKKS